MPKFNDRPDAAEVVSNTNTRAYNANEVAQVFMSFNRNDLITAPSGSTLLEPGFYGMSDPMGMRSTLERFEVNFAYGSNTSMYKIRLLNPTTELEYQFAQFFQQIYPTAHGVVDGWISDEKRREHLDSVTGDRDDYYLNTGDGSRNVVPTIYIRWGYGTEEENGLSQIHKCRVTDVKYHMNANEDKVVELMLVDLFTFTRTSNTFNKREHIAMVPWKDPSNPEGKLVSQMLMEVLGGFASVYPELEVISNLGNTSDAQKSFANKIDTHVAGVERSLAKTAQQKAEAAFNQGRSLLLTQAELGANSRPPSSATRGTDDKVSFQGEDDPGQAARPREDWDAVYQRLKDDPGMKALFEQNLNAPIASMKQWDKERKKTGEVTEAIKLQAYKIFFEQVGLHWEVNAEQNLEVFTNGVVAQKQLDDGIESSKDAWDRSEKQYDEAISINLFDYVTGADRGVKPKLRGYQNVQHGSAEEVRAEERLTFWPPILDFVDAPEIIGQSLAGVTNIEINGSGTYVKEYNFGTAPEDFYEIEDAILVHFDEVMLDNVFQYQGYDSVNERDVFTYEDSIEEVKFFDINGAVALNSETDTGEAAIQTFWLFNPNTTTPSGNPNNTAFLLRDKPTVYSDAIDSILTASDIDGILPFEPSPSGAIYSITSEKKSPPSDSPRALRAMTHDEKVRASSNQAAPLWLRPGPVNPPLNRYKEPFRMGAQEGQLNYFQSFEEDYRFSYGDLLKMFPREIYLRAMEGNPLDTTFPLILTDVRTPYQFEMGRYDEETLQSTRRYMPYYAPSYVLNRRNKNALGTVDNTVSQDYTVLKQFPPPIDKSFHPNTYPVIDKSTMELLPFFSTPEMGYEPSTILGTRNEFATWRETYCPEAEKHVDGSYRALFPADWGYGLGYGGPVKAAGSLDNWQRIENQKLYLEPTAETWDYLSKIPTQIFNDKGPRDEAYNELTEPPPLEKPKEVKVTEPPPTNGFLSLGTEGEAPNVSIALGKIKDALNSWLADSAAKIQIIVFELSRLTKSQQDDFISSVDLLPSYTTTEKTALVKENRTLLFVASDDILNSWSGRFINRIHSFPEIAVKGDGMEGIIYLDYATKDSIVTNLKFEGEYRWLLGISQATFMNRYFGSINEYFDTGAAQGRIVNRFLGQELQARINRLREHPEDVTEGGFTLAETQELFERYNRRPGQIESNMYIDSDVLALLPGLVGFYSFGNLSKIVGQQSAKDLTIISALVNDSFTLKMLFPEMEFEAGSNLKTSRMTVGTVTQSYTTPIITRRVDFQTTYMRLGEDNQRELQRKMMDTNFFFTQAMQQTMWQVEIETLGIPEIDNPVVEFTQRDVILRVYDSRLSTNTPHWLSGPYRIIGIEHAISPGDGYKTKLRMHRSDSHRRTINLAKGLEVNNA
tara:strand:- start:734 stop:4930 length:4197 start_codon:yes stop_codon:yes gene_type:complete